MIFIIIANAVYSLKQAALKIIISLNGFYGFFDF